MYRRDAKSWLKHFDFMVLDLLILQVSFVLSYWLRHGALDLYQRPLYATMGMVLMLCDLVIITGSAAINKTMPRLLELSRNAQVILTGPSVSCCPALLGLGIDRMHGRVITQPEAMLRAIVDKRTSVNA